MSHNSCRISSFNLIFKKPGHIFWKPIVIHWTPNTFYRKAFLEFLVISGLKFDSANMVSLTICPRVNIHHFTSPSLSCWKRFEPFLGTIFFNSGRLLQEWTTHAHLKNWIRKETGSVSSVFLFSRLAVFTYYFLRPSCKSAGWAIIFIDSRNVYNLFQMTK